jgi:hypothetical protein
MVKVPYLIVATQVGKLFEEELAQKDVSVDKQCNLIEEFIQACGWEIDEFYQLYNQDDKETN